MAPLGLFSWQEERTFFGSSEAASALAIGAAAGGAEDGAEEADAATDAALEWGAVTTTVEDGEATTIGNDEPESDGDGAEDEALDGERAAGGCA